jgi:hypothetical protein
MSFLTPLEEQLKSLQDLAMTDPIVYEELKHLLASDPERAHHASELLQPHRVPLSGITQQSGSAAGVDVEAMKLQRMMQKRTQMFNLISDIITKHDQTAKGIIDSMGR